MNRRRVRFPPPPLPKSLKDKELPEGPKGLAASGQRAPDAAGHCLASNDAASAFAREVTLPPAITRIVVAWPNLPPHIRDAIGTLVEASGQCLPPRAEDALSLSSAEKARQAAEQCRGIIQPCLREEEWQDAEEEFFRVICQVILP